MKHLACFHVLVFAVCLPLDDGVVAGAASARRSRGGPLRRSLQDRTGENATDGFESLDPFQFMDGVASLWTGEGDASEVAFGYLDVVNEIPLPVDATIPIGSNSKLFTAVSIYQLQERGLLDVNTDISEYLDAEDYRAFGIDDTDTFCPRLANATDEACEVVTLRHLLGMSSGLPTTLNCNPFPPNPDPYCTNLPYWLNPGSYASFVAMFIQHPLSFLPGTEYEYSNTNFVLATYFVEKFSGMTFQEYLQKNIFEPAGLNDTSFDFWNDAIAYKPKRPVNYYKYYSNSTPYELLSVGAGHTELDLGAVAGTGGLLSTAADIRKWYHVLFNRTTGGAPLFQNASTPLALLEPVTFIEKREEYFEYFGQGIVAVCLSENCTNGTKYVLYEGGTIFCATANIMDYESYAMSQLWTVTKVMFTTQKELDAASAMQSGHIEDLFPPSWSNTGLALKQLQSGEFVGTASPPPEAESTAPETTSNCAAVFNAKRFLLVTFALFSMHITLC